MDKDSILLESYRIYSEAKERFIDRSFSTNKFYLVIEVLLLAAVVFTETMLNNHLAVSILSGVGMLVSLLWWFNHDAYEYLIRVKYKHVLEKIEEQMPIAPNTMEFEASQEDARKRRAFIFSNIHKVLSLLVLLVFFVFFLEATVPYILTFFGIEMG